MAGIPHANKYRGRTASPHSVRPHQQDRVIQQPAHDSAKTGWIIGATFLAAILIAALLVSGHPWLAAIGSAAAGSIITHFAGRQ